MNTFQIGCYTDDDVVGVQVAPIMSQREDAVKFETGRIKALQEERLHIQKKTFTKWMNSFLQKARLEVDDLFTDLADGKKLLKLLEIISGEKLGKPNNGKMRVHKIENVNRSLAFLHTKVRLESIGAEDIVDGNPRLILGLLWTIILRFQIQEIEIDVDEENESSEKKSAKDALLLWCQRKTYGYQGVSIQDFTGSWRNGLGFNALIHAHRPDLIDYEALQPSRHIENLHNAFDIAQRDLGIVRLLDAEDVDTNKPDEKSIITYVASYYHTFARMKNEMKGGRRIANILGQMLDAEKMTNHFEHLTSTLLDWIRMKVLELEDRNFPNSLEGIQGELLKFKQYRTIEKPPKYIERNEIEALFFDINTKLKTLGRPVYVPPEGLLVHDIEKAWDGLEKAEHKREVDLRDELLRQERLEQLAYKFERKSVLREGYLNEMIQVLSDPRYGSNLSQVEATVKKHEAISADILAREERFHDLTNMANELVKENYHGKNGVRQREQEILDKWQHLLSLLEKHKTNLNKCSNLMSMLREIDTIMGTVSELEDKFKSNDVGQHLLGVEDLLQKHSLMESQAMSMGDTIHRLNKQGQNYITGDHKEALILKKKLETLNDAYDNLMKGGKARRMLLEDARNFFQFIQDHEDEEAWVTEKQRICKAGIVAKDLRAVLSLQQKHKALQDEMKAKWPKSEKLCNTGHELLATKHPESRDIKARVESLQEKWKILHELAALRKKQLEDAAEAYQFYTDANEADSWMKEKMPLVMSTDYGVDEPSAQSLLQRNRDLEGEIQAYEMDIQSLNLQAQKLIKSGISSLILGEPIPSEPEEEEWVNEVQVVPQEVLEYEPFERVEYHTVVEERKVPQIKSLYAFQGQGMDMAKGEVMFLLNKTNEDWWNVRKANGQDGFIPANYVREIEPKIVPVQVRKQEKVPDTRMVKKTKMVKQIVPVKKIKASKSTGQPKLSTTEKDESIEERQKTINASYEQVKNLAQQRHAFLEDAIHLYSFYRECDDFEKWMRDKEKLLKSSEDKADSVENAKRIFEKFLTDMSASSRRLEELDHWVEDFAASGHSQLEKVHKRQQQIHDLWDHLSRLKQQKERSLEGASSVELFNRTCDETKDWMHEKMNKMDMDDLGMDLKTVQALQRKHQNLERELAPVEDKFNRVNLLANSVKTSYPHERNNVNARQKELRELWDELKGKAADRRSRLEAAVGQQIFTNSTNNLLDWVATVKECLNADEAARDVVTAENLLKKHHDLGDDIRAHQDEFTELNELGSKLLKRDPDCSEVHEKMVQLQEEKKAIHRGWQEKGDWLFQCMDLQLFNREADQIDTITSSHEAFLEFEDLGVTLDDVEALMKRHDDFENTLSAQDERLKSFSDMADKLIHAGHYDSKNIHDRRNQVLQRRKAVKEKACHRRETLMDATTYQEFKSDVDDMKTWMTDKYKIANDDSYRDLTNLARKLKKHEAFEGELRANEGRLRNINKIGQGLITHDHYKKDEIDSMMGNLNEQWDALNARSQDRGHKLRQAAAQHGYNRIIEDAKVKLNEIENSLQSKEVGNDLRSCKMLLTNHQTLENEMTQWEQKINDLVDLGQEMAQEGHFDSDNILQASTACKDRFVALKYPAAQRREALEKSLQFHKFNFEIDAEMQWIKEHLPAASSEVIGQNLHQAQNMYKKHKKLEAELQGHQQMIDKTLVSGQALIDQQHPESEQVKVKCQDLKHAWEHLKECAADRNKKLELSLKAQQFFFEANEVESWMNEKNDILTSTDYGKDEDAAIKLLTKHKALELEVDTYSGLVTEMGNMAQQMINNKHPDSKMISNRQQLISQQLKNLQKLANYNRQKLMESMFRHEYFRESEDLEQWINEQMQMATSEDYGQDYEHLLVLQNKFNDFRHRIEVGEERFNQCEDLANKLITSESSYAPEIERRQEQLRRSEDPLVKIVETHEHLCKAWGTLLNHIDARDQKLQAVGEIHRFNRDVAEALSRIQEKYTSIPEDLGRDLNSVQNLMRKHEGFENDLVALEAQLQVLVDDAARLQAAYPGSNAQHILEEQTMVIEQWNVLQDRTAQRKSELQASTDLQRFLASVRDLVSWASGLCATMMTEEKVRDAASAQILKAEHERLKAEIEAREENFSTTVQAGENQIHGNHYASQEIQEKLTQLLNERQKLHAAWQHKKVFLDQLIDLHFFLRDAKQLDTISSAQEVALANTDFGSTVEEVDAQVKKHDAFEKLILTQDEKLGALQEHGTKLVKQNHFDNNNIQKRMENVTLRRAKVKDLSSTRKQRLADALLHAQFVRDVAEAESWIEEKQKKLEAENTKTEVTSLEDKIKKLQKHQAFQAELTANEGRINEIKEKGETLLAKRHEASREIHTQLEHLLGQWNHLLLESNNLGRGLEEAHDILEFNSQVEKIEAWIRDKEMMVQAGDMGRDYEHCLALQRKLDDVGSDMRVDDSRMKSIGALADKLIRQGRSDTRMVQQCREELNQKWKALQGALEEYREHLAGALEIHAFNRDVDDTNDRINEKALFMSAEDFGKDLNAVESLQRKQEAIERDMTAIEGKLKEHDNEARRLVQKYPDMAAPIRTKLSEVQDNWRHLNQLCHNRKQLLASSYTLQKFMTDMKELEAWVVDMTAKMNSSSLANTIAEAEAKLQVHQERKAEIDGRQQTFKALKEFGHRLIQQNHQAKEELEQNLTHLEELRRTLTSAWEEQRHILTQCHQLQCFREQAEQADDWLASKEAFLNNEDLGESMSSVETLIRKHNAFEKTVEAQGNKIDELEKFAMELIAGKHYSSEAIGDRLQAICKRQDNLKEASMVRRKKLQKSKHLQQFLRNIYEVETWITEKMQVASDESYRDPTNLQSKIQKHQAFEAELMANNGRVNAVTQEGEQLIGASHFASMEIQSQLNELELLWRQLQDETQLKKDRLHDAYQALLFSRTLEDLDAWMDDVEVQLQSEDHGKDLTSVHNLLKKHQMLELDISNHAENIEQVKDTAANFENNNHFMKEEIQDRAQSLIKRYQGLHEPVQIRRDNLEDAHLLQQFFRDLEDELLWIGEKEPLASSTDLGSSLTAVQNLQKKHQALEAEIQSHEPLIGTVSSRAQQMIRSNHFATSLIEAKMQDLQEKLCQLKDQASIRRLRLLDAVESQMFYTEVNEAETWIREKMPLLTSVDSGKDEDSVQSLMKKLDGLQLDISNFNNTIGKLAKLSQGLTERGHFDSDNIREKQNDVETKYKELQMLAEERQNQLRDRRKLFKFLREAEEVVEWINDQTAVAASEDYGRDVEHVEILIQKFESFLSSLQSSEERRTSVRNTAKLLISENHPEPEKINTKVEEIQQLWEDLRELANARQEALAGAKQVHVFDRNADETISWIQEKDAVLSSEDYGHDLESIQALVRRHQGFERDLAAVKEQVEAVVSEAKRLADLFPDAREHISVKHEETVEAWNELLDKSAQRKDKLSQAEQLQAYFDEYRDLLAWINEMIAKITAPDLARDVPGAETLISRHMEYKAEIDTRLEALSKFSQTGNHLIEQGHFMADEIQEKVAMLEERKQALLETWENRKILYEQNLDTQFFKRDAEQLESWLQSREPALQDSQLGESITQVEELIRKHEDFQKTIEAQEDKFNAVKRITLVEEAFQTQKKKEEEMRKAEAQRKEQERIDAIKKKEVKRITDERRRDDERRRTQEIKFNKEDGERSTMTMNGDMRSSRSSSVEKLTRHTSEEGSPRSSLLKVGGPVEVTEIGNLKKMGSQSSLTGMKRGEKLLVNLLKQKTKPQASGSDVKRAESMKVENKKQKRTPSFTTRRRTQSFRKLKRMDNMQNLPPVEVEGYLERKQELQSGGKRATIRSWKTYYTVLCGQLLCFFKDQEDFLDSKASSSPVTCYQARCEKAQDYTKKKHVFRIHTTDGSEYLFAAEDEKTMEEWVAKLAFHAHLPPSMQLLSYDTHKESGIQKGLTAAGSHGGRDHSSDSSQSSTPDTSHRHGSDALSRERISPQKQQPIYANVDVAQQQQGSVYDQSKPPIPPRGSGVPPARSSREESSIVQSRLQAIEGNRLNQDDRIDPTRSGNILQGPGSTNGFDSNQVWIKRDSGRLQDSAAGEEAPPPLPSSSPPILPMKQPPPPPSRTHRQRGSEELWCDVPDHAVNNTSAAYRQSYPHGDSRGSPMSRTGSLPSHAAPPTGHQAKQYATLDSRQRNSESSSEGDNPVPPTRSKGEKDMHKRGSVLGGLFKRKKATHL